MKTALALFKLIRPKQWIKNIIVLFGLLFSGSFLEYNNVKAAVLAFSSFIFISSSVYIINDLKDRENDRYHPEKKNRPLASGEISAGTALFFGTLFLVFSLYLGNLVNVNFTVAILIYLAMNIAYTLFVKNFVIVDVFFISSGYVIRVIAGVLAVNVLPTIWLIASILFASLFIGFSKRRGELVSLGVKANSHRVNLESYTIEFLNAMVFINAGIALATYLLFVIFLSEQHQLMIVTVPFVAFAAYRYIYLVFNSGRADSPENLFLDKPLMLNNVIWVILFILTKLDYFGTNIKLFKLVQ